MKIMYILKQFFFWEIFFFCVGEIDPCQIQNIIKRRMVGENCSIDIISFDFRSFLSYITNFLKPPKTLYG